jgi:2-polyprenyl-3-methyl-5-hydroxy-6-metoxy-1,4-benzoquinol methylase
MFSALPFEENKMYELIANNYSSIFPVDIETVDFIDSCLLKNDKSSILDIGCATGDLAIALSKKGYSVVGIDLDAKMIKIAESKINNDLLTFKNENMLKLDRNIKYDCILCLGNTLPHVPSWKELNQFINLLHSKINDNDFLIIQILNYDKILKDGNITFQTKEGIDFLFTRRYISININTITFEIEIFDKKTLERHTDSTKLLPIERRKLVDALVTNGFEEAKVFSDYNGTQASENDYYNVFVAQKGKKI